MVFQNFVCALRTVFTKFRVCLFIIMILLIWHNKNIVALEKMIPKQIRNMKTIEFKSEPLYRVIVNRDNNDIIVGARNAIYKLSQDDFEKNEEFIPREEFITGPVNDSLDCLPPPARCEARKSLADNDNQILLIKYDHKDFPLLLACGDAYQGICYFLKAANLSYIQVYNSTNDHLNYVGSKSSSFAFFAPYSKSTDVLYVAHSYDGRPVEFSPPSISSRKLNGNNGLALTHESGASSTKVDFHPKYKRTFNVKYLYGFNYTHYSYFLSTQPISVRETQEHETKLIRICQNDAQFTSYVEIPLICGEEEVIGSNHDNNNEKNKNPMYFVASTAYFGKIGSNKFRELDIKSENDSGTLFVAFSEQAHVTSFNKSVSSAICAFSMNKINKAFNNAAKDCFHGGSEVEILELIVGEKRECVKTDSGNDYCGSSHNPYVESRRPLNGLFLNSIQGSITSLAVAIQGSKSVAVIGTEDGRIMKVLMNEGAANQKPLFETTISGQSSDRSIRPNPAFDNQEEYLYLLSGNQLVKFPFSSCSLHADCASCLDPSDPLGCGWCGDYCATDKECMHPTLMSRSWCPPELFEFTPKSGPLSGGTIVAINGSNLGKPHQSSGKSDISVTIAGSECEVIDWQPTRVRCRTKPVEKEVSGLIKIFVHDVDNVRDRFYNISGTAISQQKFKYVDPQLLGVNPSFGPYAGGTNVTIFGNNLYIGSNRTILLAGIKCIEIDNNSTFLSCISGTFDDKLLPFNDTSVKVFIDTKELTVNQNRAINLDLVRDLTKEENYDRNSTEWSQFFQYLPNPEILSFEPKSTISSGNTDIEVIGNNLNSVKNPRMQILAINANMKEEIRAESSCEVYQSGTKMICRTPPIRDRNSTQKIKASIETQINFIMDGVEGLGPAHEMPTLIYFPDPDYYLFSENDNLRIVYIEEPILKIDGKDLSTNYPIDIKISDRIPCNSTKSNSFDAIYCEIEYDENLFIIDNREHSVDIRVGEIHSSPGRIKFASKPSTVSISIITVSTLVLLLLIVIIVIYYLKSSGIIFKKCPPLASRYNSDVENGEQLLNVSQHSQSSDETVTETKCQVQKQLMDSLRDDHILIERRDIILEDPPIGAGYFGCVYKGILHSHERELDKEVAVKTLQRSSNREKMDTESFLKEGLIMKDFEHPHVLSLIGICINDVGSPMVVLPYMQNGDLLSYIEDENNMLTVKTLLTFAIDVAKGMHYLSSQKVVHRDLAARNCMLDSNLSVKVADFGLSRDIYERQYYRSQNSFRLPIKWMSPESLEMGTYNTKTDVWSYGVLVWELLTRGGTPYSDVHNWEISNYLKQGRRLPKPSHCPELIYSILLKCWSIDPKSRPNFAELSNNVQAIITQLEETIEQQKVGLDVTYVNYPNPETYAKERRAQNKEPNKLKASEFEITI